VTPKRRISQRWENAFVVSGTSFEYPGTYGAKELAGKVSGCEGVLDEADKALGILDSKYARGKEKKRK